MPMPRHRSSILAVALLCVSASTARAQVPTDTAHHFAVDPTKVTPSEFVYELRVVRDSVPRVDSVKVDSVKIDTIIKTDTVYRPFTFYRLDTIPTADSASIPLGGRSVSVIDSKYLNVPAWLLLEMRTTSRGVATDSLILRRVDLHPLHWGATLSGSRLAAEFVGDTALFGATSGPTGRRSVVARVPAGTMISGAMLETYLRLLPLQPGWRDSTLALSVTLGSDLLLPATFGVVGEEQVTVPAGTFDCWIVDARAGTARTRYWIAKQDASVVRSLVPLPNDRRARLVTELLRVTH